MENIFNLTKAIVDGTQKSCLKRGSCF